MFYLIRHGESVGNADNRYQGPEVLLSDLGRSQAKERALMLSEQSIERVIASPLVRAHETAQIIHDHLPAEVPLEIHEQLYELQPPSFFKGRLKTDPDMVAIKTEITANRLDPSYRHSDEETLFMLHNRVLGLTDFLRSYSSENVVVVTHGGVLRMFLAFLQTQTNAHDAVSRHLDLEKDANFAINNVAMITCSYEQGKWAFHELNNLF